MRAQGAVEKQHPNRALDLALLMHTEKAVGVCLSVPRQCLDRRP